MWRETDQTMTYHLGDRVTGRYLKKIPFTGSVANDAYDPIAGYPTVGVFLDLPILVDGELTSFVKMRYTIDSTVRLMPTLDDAMEVIKPKRKLKQEQENLE
jgi:hypothetical protein